MYISRKKFTTYEEIRASGLTNMFDLDEVLNVNVMMSDTMITKKECIWIMKHYEKLCQKFGFIRVQSV